jgi:hypothetical protein
MGVTIKEVFDRQFDHVKFDAEFCKRVIQYSIRFMNRNEDHSAFFGGVLLGVNPVKFFDSDRDSWYEDVLEVDEDLFLADFRKIDAINHEFNVMSDAFNYTPAYIVHRLMKATGVAQSLRHEAMVHAYMVLHYRFITSLLVKRFQYPADKEVATATYLALNGRFDIRRYGSWRDLIRARAEDIVSAKSIYYRCLQDFQPDGMLIRTVTDTQSRIRELIKKIYAIHKHFSDTGVRVKTTSDTTINADGEMVLKDRKNGYASFMRYINDIIPSERNFIRDELVDVVASGMNTMPKPLLVTTLRYMSNNYFAPHQNYLQEIVKEVLLYSFDHLYVNRLPSVQRNDLATNIAKLKALLTASRSTDPSVMLLRTEAEKLVRQATGRNKYEAQIAAVRTGTLLYIVLRAMTKDYYTKR